MVHEPESDQSVYVEQIDHGKFARISSTCLLLNVGALGAALRTGRPVTESVMSLTRCARFRCGVNTIRPFSMFASKASPGRMPRRRRSGPGRTTCPSVEIVYFKVYESQIPVVDRAIETVALMLGSDRSRGYCLEMICADYWRERIWTTGIRRRCCFPRRDSSNSYLRSKGKPFGRPFTKRRLEPDPAEVVR
jgi:hypothetical protein